MLESGGRQSSKGGSLEKATRATEHPFGQKSPKSQTRLFREPSALGPNITDRKGTPKNLRDKDFAELSDELSGAICLKTLVLLGSALELFRKFFGAVRVVFRLWGSFLAHANKSRKRVSKGPSGSLAARVFSKATFMAVFGF